MDGYSVAEKCGKLTFQEMDEFRIKHTSAFIDVPGVTHEDGRRDLLQKLPEQMRKWVIEAEQKLARHSPIVRLEMKGNFSVDAVSASVELWPGKKPEEVSDSGEGWFQVSLSDEKMVT